MRKHIHLIMFVLVFIRSFANSEIFDKLNNDPKTVFLTGTVGFIGSNFLVSLFEKYSEYDFIVLDALRNEPFTIHGSEEPSRDLLLTQELALAIDRVLHIPDFVPLKNQVINIGSCKPTSVLETAKLILASFNSPDSCLKFIEKR